MLVEQTPTDLGVHRVRELRLQVGDALLDLRLLLGLDDGLVVDGDEPGEGELVHGVDILQLDDAEEENSCVIGNWFVTVSRLVDLVLCCSCNFLLGSDLLRQYLGGGEDLNRGLVLQDVPLRAGEHL